METQSIPENIVTLEKATETETKTLTPYHEINMSNGHKIKISLGKEEFGTHKPDESRTGFGIFFENEDGEETLYRTVEGPMLHSQDYPSDRIFNNSAERERDILKSLASLSPDQKTNLVMGLREQTEKERQVNKDSFVEHIVGGLSGFNLHSVVDTLEESESQLLASQEKEVLTLRLLASTLKALKQFDSTGNIHVHPQPRNFYVGENGVVHIIDYSISYNPESMDNPRHDFNHDLQAFIEDFTDWYPELFKKLNMQSLKDVVKANQNYQENAEILESTIQERMNSYPQGLQEEDLYKKMTYMMIEKSLKDIGVSAEKSDMDNILVETNQVIEESPTVLLPPEDIKTP